MKRSGFKSKAPRRPERQMDYTPRPRIAAAHSEFGPGRWLVVAPGPFQELRAMPKREYVRSPALLRACRELACQHCGAAGPDAGVCAAHSNWAIHGKGGHIKADDNRVAALCKNCHVPLLDQGAALSAWQRKLMWWSAHVKTVRALLKRKLWPEGVPIPEIEENPFHE